MRGMCERRIGTRLTSLLFQFLCPDQWQFQNEICQIPRNEYYIIEKTDLKKIKILTKKNKKTTPFNFWLCFLWNCNSQYRITLTEYPGLPRSRHVIRQSNLWSSAADPCLYRLDDGEHHMVMAVVVNDICCYATNDQLRSRVFEQLKKRFDLKVIGHCEWFLGSRIQYVDTGSYLDQRSYLLNLIKQYKDYVVMKKCDTPAFCHKF